MCILKKYSAVMPMSANLSRYLHNSMYLITFGLACSFTASISVFRNDIIFTVIHLSTHKWHVMNPN